VEGHCREQAIDLPHIFGNFVVNYLSLALLGVDLPLMDLSQLSM